MRKDKVKTLVTQNYVKKSLTIRPTNDNQLFSRKQIKEYCQKQMLKLGINDRMTVTGLNILRNSSLKSYEDDFMDDEEWNEYCNSKVRDSSKYDKFYSFTITIRQPNN